MAFPSLRGIHGGGEFHDGTDRRIELGVVFPWLHRSFAFAGNLDYGAPKASGTETDARIMSGGKYT